MCSAKLLKDHLIFWFAVCTGGVLTRKAHWWSWRKIVRVCTVGAPAHFHFQCKVCGYHWLMRTRTEPNTGGKSA